MCRLVLVANGGTNLGSSAWWYNVNAVLCAYRIVLEHTHVKGTADAVRTDVDWPVLTDHAFLVHVRRSDGLYVATPTNVTSNFGSTTLGWSWTYPINTADGTDRFDGTAITDGLLGLPRNRNTKRDIDYAGVRRRMGARSTTNQLPPPRIPIG